jgi:hypothetical protein
MQGFSLSSSFLCNDSDPEYSIVYQIKMQDFIFNFFGPATPLPAHPKFRESA